MSTRRRIKAAAILKPRRPNSTAINESDENNPVKIEQNVDEQDAPVSVELNGSSANVEITTTLYPQKQQNDVKPSNLTANEANFANKLEGKLKLASNLLENKPPLDAGTSNNVAIKTSTPNPIQPTPFRRISTPPVNIVNRRKSVIASEHSRSGYSSPKYMKSPAYSFVRDLQTKDHKPNSSPHHNHSAKTTDDEIASPAPPDNDECFKSPPFMSPIYTRRIDPSMSPFHDIYGDDCTKSPSALPNNTKIRQRIRPTPCFANRRNSIQGNGFAGGMSESEDDPQRRQRHYSTSSNHSSYNPATTPQYQRNYFGLNKVPSRVRTESYSSSISDIPFSKSKRSHRSEEYQRVANAKREFSQRLNGKPPDKSRLTMYDLIYYNPLTNPMSKPAGKGDKNSDTASMTSIKTNQSQQSRSSSSVKSEASSTTGGPVKTEKSENNETVTGPVPQLKLDANGEIILDEKSLVIETTGNKEAREMLANSDVVYDDEFSGTSGFYKRQKRTRDWLPLETLKFYRSLQTIGTDFSVMLQLFPNRSRRDLKLKFKKEEKHNMALINKALLHPKEFNVDELKLQFDKEDEEIELKKQEWAEVRKKMANERREQLNASKKRNPSKQVSRLVRSLTEGDLVYENEFVSLPPKTRRNNRKRNVINESVEAVLQKTPSGDSMQSPTLSLNHNNNHVETLPQHTYATQMLPSFAEMISSQKSQQSITPPPLLHSDAMTASVLLPTDTDPISDTPIDFSTHNTAKQMQTDSNCLASSSVVRSPVHSIDQSSSHAIDLSITQSQSMPQYKIKESTHIETVPKSNSNSIHYVNDSSVHSIGEYIAKNPNLTFKGSGDIMNMDIIFDNVPIEEDMTIGKSAITVAEVPPPPPVTTEERKVNSDAHVENVKMDGIIQYEIITLESANNDDKTKHRACDNDAVANSLTDFKVGASPMKSRVDASRIPVIAHDTTTARNYEFDSGSTAVVVVSESRLEVSDEIKTGETVDVDDTVELNASAIKIDHSNPIAKTDVALDSSVASTSTANELARPHHNKTNTTEQVQASTAQTTTVQTGTENITSERKRKRKVVPLLATNKRTRRSNANNIESKPECVVPSIESQENPVMVKQSPSAESSIADASKVDHRDNHDHQHDQKQEQTSLTTTNEIECQQTVDDEPKPNDNNDGDGGGGDGGQERSFMDSLVVVESQDPNDPNRTIHEVYVMDPETNLMSEKPLELPEEVIQRIRLSM